MANNIDPVAVVTGGGSGIGLAVAESLAGEGFRVAILGRNPARLESAVKNSRYADRLRAFPCDVVDRQRVNTTFSAIREQLGVPKVLVNSAGINVANRSMAVLSPDDWDRILAVHATGTFNCMQAVLPMMREQRDGLIINISSIAGKRALELAGPAYCAGKFAMTALGMAAGLEERHNGIRITNIYPGEVNTPILEQRPTPVPEEQRRRMLQPEDVAQVVLTIVRLPPRAHVWEVVLTPLYQAYA
ncbi:3-oxoacyl-[acyl-carrier protein] reductase [Thermogutta terrifontis]|uniref:3-oxoacyl-[acyl-carrier protein] reductase n=1 Tax=Thermogutta terrifontis TaxID=1331910 RepID=A0A286RJT1_9BACT|nr:SDR family oxidoreductase [Thermogutta terrifontis]ASV76223.1 3-oxoacyl-[acyl-carrier protein] reductase [Thermogutta terrifontis]